MQTIHALDDKDNAYTLVYMEDYDVILVWKNRKLTYRIRIGKKRRLSCDCKGHVYRGKCRHVDFATEEFNFSRTIKPRSLINVWNNEYLQDWLETPDEKRQAWLK